jgi:ABC-2 type transport system permease protein
MNKTLIVLKHEFKTVAGKPSFWFGILVAPFLVGIMVAVIGLTSGLATAAVIAQQQSRPEQVQGFVDQAGLITQPAQGFEPFADEAAAKQALASGAINAFYVIPADYLQTGNVRMIANEIEDTPTGPRSREGDFNRMLRQNLLSGNAELAAQVNNRVSIAERQSVTPQDAPVTGGRSFGGFSPLVYGIAILFFILLMTASAYLMQSVTTEKENRIMEVLMSSVTPRQLLTGKILGLSLVGLIQLALWFGSAIFALTSLPFLRDLVGGISPIAVVLTVVFFILGYFVYASLLAGLGALMPGSREAAQYTFLVVLPLILPIYLNTAIAAEPNGPIATVLSLFPLTAPIVMPMRLFSTAVPPLELAISVALLAGTVYLAVTGASRAFRAQSLLSGTKPTFKQVVAAFR